MIRSFTSIEGLILYRRALRLYFKPETENEALMWAKRAVVLPGGEEAAWLLSLHDKFSEWNYKAEKDDESAALKFPLVEERKRLWFYAGQAAYKGKYVEISANLGYVPAMNELLSSRMTISPADMARDKKRFYYWLEKAAIAGAYNGMFYAASNVYRKTAQWSADLAERLDDICKLHGITLERAALSGSVFACRELAKRDAPLLLETTVAKRDAQSLLDKNAFWSILEFRWTDYHGDLNNVLTDSYPSPMCAPLHRYQMGLCCMSLLKDGNYGGDYGGILKKMKHEAKFKFDDHVLFYMIRVIEVKDAVSTWIGVGKRLNVVRDVRKMIGLLVWEMRYSDWKKNE